MPIDNSADRGTEKDGTKSELYCRYCFKDGEFTDPGMTLEKMTTICTDEMKKQNLPAEILAQSLKMLPLLKRWNTTNTTIK
jgi:hypothetical protein